MEHLCSIMGKEYLDSHIRVRSFNKVTQVILHNKLEMDASELFWRKPQEIHLKKPCTSTINWAQPPLALVPTPIMNKRGHRHHQYHTIVQTKAQHQQAEQRKVRKKAAKT